MSAEYSDSLIDSLLGEVLGDESPPDLRDRILQSYRRNSSESQSANGEGAQPKSVIWRESAMDRVVDVLLDEILGAVTAPNMTQKILAKVGWTADSSIECCFPKAPQPGDQIVTSMLSEMLAGEEPPCVKDKVLQALTGAIPKFDGLAGAGGTEPATVKDEELRVKAGERIVTTFLYELLGDVDQPNIRDAVLADAAMVARDLPVVMPLPKAATRAASTRRARRIARWQGWVTVAAVMAIAGFVVHWASDEAERIPGSKSGVGNVAMIPGAQPYPKPSPAPGNGDVPHSDSSSSPPTLPVPLPIEVAETAPPPPVFHRSRSVGSPASNDVVVDFIDKNLAQYWAANGLEPTPSVNDEEWAHRAYRFLVGRDPTRAELLEFRRRRDRSALASELVDGVEFAKIWGARFANTLVGNVPDKEVFDGYQLEEYLEKSIFSNKPYDELAYELISAVGSNDPDERDFNPAVNFVLAHQRQGGNQELITDKVCRVLLGKRLGCAQCHDHPLDAWNQRQFWEMESFFAQVKAANSNSRGRLVNQDYFGETRIGAPQEAERLYQLPNRELAAAYPRFPDGVPLATRSGLVKDVDRRTTLANQIAASDALTMAMVNRIWGQAFGTGFTEPVDDMGNHNPPTHPALIKRLARELEARNFNVKPLAEWIVLSSAFERQVRRRGEFYAIGGRADGFSSYRERSNAVEQIALALDGLRDFRKEQGASVLAQQFDLKKRQESQDKEMRLRKDRAQGKLQHSILGDEDGSFLRRIEANGMPFDDKVRHLFWTTLGRQPSIHELNSTRRLLEATSAERTALEDTAWTIVNSQEFIQQN